LGLVAGILGKVIMPGKDPGGWFITILLGIAGAFVGGWVGSFVGLGTTGGFSFGSIMTEKGIRIQVNGFWCADFIRVHLLLANQGALQRLDSCLGEGLILRVRITCCRYLLGEVF